MDWSTSTTRGNPRGGPFGQRPSYSGRLPPRSRLPRKPFALSIQVQPRVNGLSPRAFRIGPVELIDGDHNGTAGGNAIAILVRSGVSIAAIASASMVGQFFGILAVVDDLWEQGEMLNMLPASNQPDLRISNLSLRS